eukprot:scaffold12986_cov148-Isochrysis_galbana.AAC.3
MASEPKALPQCALVSTAGSLTGKMHGPEIDAHEAVIRLGQGPTGGHYMQDVGSRTDVRIANTYIFTSTHSNLTMFKTTLESEGWPRIVLLASDCHSRRERWAMVLSCIPVPRCAANLVRRAKPTSGLNTALLLLGGNGTQMPPWMPRCDSLHLYGFGGTDDPSAPYHYWSDGTYHDKLNSTKFYETSRRQSGHSFNQEHALLRTKLGGNTSLDGPFIIQRAAVAAQCATKRNV